MAPPQKTTPEQYTWLTRLQSKFAEYQKSKKVAEFWVELDRDWFARWPEPRVAEAECEPPGHPSREIAAEALRQRKLKLKNWFNNRTLNKRKTPIKIEPPMPPTRTQQPLEVYSKQFYKEKVQPLVKAEIKEQGTEKKDRLSVVKKFTKEVFDAEPEDVRQEIFAQAAFLKAENAKRKAQVRKAEPDTSPEGYAAAIESVPDILDVFFRDLALRTGWAFSVLCGGPDPANGGRIQTISFHEGKNFLGASFKKSHISFEQSVLKPYVEFLGQIYTPGDCTARALPESADDFRPSTPMARDPQPNTQVPSTTQLVMVPMATETVGPHEPSAPTASTTVGLTASGTPPDSMALIDPTLRPASATIGIAATIQAPTPETAPTNSTMGLHAPLAPVVNDTDPQDILLPLTTPYTTTDGQPFVFPSTISFVPPDTIGTALHVPPAITPVVLSTIPAISPEPLCPALPQGPFDTIPTHSVLPNMEPSPVAPLATPPAPKAKKHPAASKKKPVKKPSTKTTPTKLPNLEPSTAVSTPRFESISAPNKVQQIEKLAGITGCGGLQTGQGQRIRKPAISKEVVPLTDDKENKRQPKRARIH